MRRGHRARPGPEGRQGGGLVALAAAARAILIVLLAGAACILALKVSVGGVFADAKPSMALFWMPHNSFAKANLAARLVPAGRVDEGRQHALDALARNPINVEAARTLAMSAEARQDQGGAARLFTLANAMSRRDRLTQLWLIRSAIERGDYEAAMRGLDIAMRTSDRATEYLGPLVVAATADRRILPPLAHRLDNAPAWRAGLLRMLVDAGPNLQHVALLVRGRLNPSIPEERTSILVFLHRLAQQGQYDLAWSVYRGVAPGDASAGAGVRNGGFEQDIGFPPFDWELTDENDLMGLRGARPDGRGGSALSLVARNRSGAVARQVLRLAPGQYRIAFDAGSVPASPADRPRVAVSCAANAQALGEWMPAGAGEAPQRVAGSLQIPPGCPWQWLTVSLNMDEAPDEDPWIDNLAIQP